ncbi:hypothetical protein RKD42_000341 [Streptomyces ambofaciens]
MAADRTPDAKSLFEAWLQLWNGDWLRSRVWVLAQLSCSGHGV